MPINCFEKGLLITDDLGLIGEKVNSILAKTQFQRRFLQIVDENDYVVGFGFMTIPKARSIATGNTRNQNGLTTE